MLPTPSEPSPGSTPPHTPYLRQLALQCAAVFGVLSVAWPYFGLRAEGLPWPETAFAIGGIALLIATLTHQPWWWRTIHFLFAPTAWATSLLAVDPRWFLLAFFLLLLTYRGALSGQIPLFLSNRHAASKLAELCSDQNCRRFIDLGAGIASIALPLAKARPEMTVTGFENAPIAWFLGFVRTLQYKNCSWHWGDLWQVNLADYDVIYAFLSPAPMAALWEKAIREMRPGCLFVSNSFPIPGVEANRIFNLDDPRQTCLYCYTL